MTAPRTRRKRKSGLAWIDLRSGDEPAFMAAYLWLCDERNESPVASGYGEHALEAWGHTGPPRPDMAERALISHFGSLSEARRVWRTLSKRSRVERPELAAFMESADDESR